jgi:hypothetical protein
MVDYTCLYGVTHSPEGEAILYDPKLIRVAIGIAAGKAIWPILAKDKWTLMEGVKAPYTFTQFDDRASCEAAYRARKPKAPETKHPRKLTFFTFTRETAEGDYEPDFAAIEAHGSTPKEIEILFVDNFPWRSQYSMYGARLKCRGNGRDAERAVDFVTGPEEKELAQAAKKAGEQFYILRDKCAESGCRFARDGECKPSGQLKFQLANHVRLGGTSYFHTTGKASIRNIYTMIYRLISITGGRIAGIPITMSLKPAKAVKDGKTMEFQTIVLEIRAENMTKMRSRMVAAATAFYEPLALPAATATDDLAPGEEILSEPEQARLRQQEFSAAAESTTAPAAAAPQQDQAPASTPAAEATPPPAPPSTGRQMTPEEVMKWADIDPADPAEAEVIDSEAEMRAATQEQLAREAEEEMARERAGSR